MVANIRSGVLSNKRTMVKSGVISRRSRWHYASIWAQEIHLIGGEEQMERFRKMVG